MKKALWYLLILIMALSLAAACGGDDDDDSDTDGDTPEDGDSPNDDYFANCGTGEEDACEQMICGYESAFEGCSGAYCDALLECIKDLYECICPDGELDNTGSAACTNTYTQCAMDAATAGF